MTLQPPLLRTPCNSPKRLSLDTESRRSAPSTASLRIIPSRRLQAPLCAHFSPLPICCVREPVPSFPPLRAVSLPTPLPSSCARPIRTRSISLRRSTLAGHPSARILSWSIRFVIWILAITMTLEELGLARQTVISAFSIVFGATMLGLAIVFGLSGQNLARKALERYFGDAKKG
jgi:hypothetical protein